MDELNNIIETPIMQKRHFRERQEIRNAFLETDKCPHNHYLVLRKYLKIVPHKYYNPKVYAESVSWYKSRDSTSREELVSYFKQHESEINTALYNLEEINLYPWHDKVLGYNEHEIIQFVDRNIHPTYLRLIEAVYTPLLHVFAFFSRRDRIRGTEKLNIYNIIEELKNNRLMSNSWIVYRHAIRNAIAHGGVIYLQNHIQYNNQEKYSYSEVIRNFDDILDTCNALCLGMSAFLLSNQGDRYVLPQRLLLHELQEETQASWWNVTGVIPSEVETKQQLNIFVKTNTIDINKVQYSSFQTGVLAEQFAPGYDRYFFSISSNSKWPGWTALDGKILREARKSKLKSLDKYYGVFENNTVFYIPKYKTPKLIRKLDSFRASFSIHQQMAKDDYIENMKLIDIAVRDAKIHRNGWRSVVNASIVVNNTNNIITKDSITKSIRRIIRKVHLHSIRKAEFTNIAKYLPLGYINITIFQKDYRCRRLLNYGIDADLVGTLKMKKIKRIRDVDIVGAQLENFGRYRIAWNQAWKEK